jgi:small subunit ribosomal protein S20
MDTGEAFWASRQLKLSERERNTMPNIKSAVKRMRQNVKRRATNRAQRSALRTALKKANLTIASGDAAAVQAQLPLTISSLGKNAQKGQIHKKKAARLTSRLTRKANAMTDVKASS